MSHQIKKDKTNLINSSKKIETKVPKSFGEELRLYEKKIEVENLGFDIFQMKMIVMSYKTSRLRNRGLSINFDGLMMYIGNQDQNSVHFTGWHPEVLDDFGINPYAVRHIAYCYINAFKHKSRGIHVLIDETPIMIGPQRDPITLR